VTFWSARSAERCPGFLFERFVARFHKERVPARSACVPLDQSSAQIAIPAGRFQPDIPSRVSPLAPSASPRNNQKTFCLRLTGGKSSDEMMELCC